MPEAMLAARMPILEVSISALLAKARLAMKSDMVKPMPPSMPTPRIWRQFTPLGSAANRVRTASQAKETMPIGLPSASPQMIPTVEETPPDFVKALY